MVHLPQQTLDSGSTRLQLLRCHTKKAVPIAAVPIAFQDSHGDGALRPKFQLLGHFGGNPKP